MASALVAVFIIMAMSGFSFDRIAIMAQSDNCQSVEFTTDKCRSAEYITVLGQRINKGESKRIQLPSMQEKQVRWYCGQSEERTAWNTPANQLRVMYQSDGSIRWSIYKCADLSGPKKAGEKCAVPETTEFCPKFDVADSDACVFELTKSTSHVNQKTTTVSIEGTLRAEVEKKAGPLTAKASAEAKAGVSHSVTKAKVVKYESRQFLVIPPGFSFCAFTNNTSVPDVHSPTGFRWRCMFPEYIQSEERFSNGRCTSLEICDAGVCGRAAVGAGGTVHIGHTAILLFICLFAFLRIY